MKPRSPSRRDTEHVPNATLGQLRPLLYLQCELKGDAVIALDALAVLVAQRQLAERVRASVLDRQLEKFNLAPGAMGFDTMHQVIIAQRYSLNGKTIATVFDDGGGRRKCGHRIKGRVWGVRQDSCERVMHATVNKM